MTIRQLHYTSCRQGRDGIDGFQVAAGTPGLPARHEQLALPLAAYRPSPGAPPVPTAGELARFPVSVGYRSFGDVAVLFHSSYVGTDFTGRQGNYFAHLLILDSPARDLGLLLPAETWGAPQWQRERAESRQLGELPAPPAGRLADRDVLRAELRTVVKPFGALLGAVVRALTGRPRRVVAITRAVDDVGELAVLLAGASRSLPAALATEMSFTTFSSTPRDVDVLVVGTTPDVTLPSASPGEMEVVRLGDPAAATPPGAYAELAVECWAAGTAVVERLVALAGEISPPLLAADLDSFAPLARVLVTGTDDPDIALAGLEFALDRSPRMVAPAFWDRMEHAAPRAASAADLERWSAALGRATTTPGPGMEAAYLESLLDAVATGSVEHSRMWVPPGGGFDDTVVAWVQNALREDPTLDAASRVLPTAERLGVALPDDTLRQIAQEVVIPSLFEHDDPAAAIGALPRSEQLLQLVCDHLETSLIDSPDLFATIVEGITAPAASVLADAARGRTGCTTAARLARARHGEADRVDTVVRIAGRDDPRRLEWYARLVWAEPPSAGEGARLCRDVLPKDLAATDIPALLMNRLRTDTLAASPSHEACDLARGLSKTPLRDTLDAPDRDLVNAIRAGERFGGNPTQGKETEKLAVEAVRLGELVPRPCQDWVLDRVVEWLLRQQSSLFHAPVLSSAVHTSGGPFVDRYAERLADVLERAEPPMVAVYLPAVFALPAGRNREQLDVAARNGLRRRKSKDLDQVGKALEGRKKVLATLPTPDGGDWPAWWQDWRTRNFGQHSGKSLLRRLNPLGRLGGHD